MEQAYVHAESAHMCVVLLCPVRYVCGAIGSSEVCVCVVLLCSVRYVCGAIGSSEVCVWCYWVQ